MPRHYIAEILLERKPNQTKYNQQLTKNTQFFVDQIQTVNKARNQ